MQPVDFTTLVAACAELRRNWLPARCEQVIQRDRTTLSMALRTLDQRGWLTISWHPQAARLHIGQAPPRMPDTFTFSQQLKHQLNGLALTHIAPIAPWERALDLCFANRPGDPVQWHLYVEVMGKYSNVILVNARNQIVTAAHQVSAEQSSVRPVLTGTPYEPPPAMTGPLPSLAEGQARWQERVALLPGTLKRCLMQAYSGLSSALVRELIQKANLDPAQAIATLTPTDWARLFQQWQHWLQCLQTETFQPEWIQDGYSVLGGLGGIPAPSVQQLLQGYYTDQLNRQTFERLKNQLTQKLKTLLKKLQQKQDTFTARLEQSEQAEHYRQQADLLMAYSYQWQPGMTTMTLPDFETGNPITIALDPDKTAVQTAQALYKRHQKLKRARQAILPLVAEVQSEQAYLEQVEAALSQIERYAREADLAAIADIRDELIQQGYLDDPTYRPSSSRDTDAINARRFKTPNGFEVWVGRNNRQNDLLISRIATDYDLWFHTQEIPGSHVLLRLDPGAAPSDEDLQCVANLAAYFSRAQQADQVPVVYTEPRHVYKPKGARPGMVTYSQERVLWGHPQQIQQPPAILAEETQLLSNKQ